MKSNSKILLCLFAVALLFTACQKDTEAINKVEVNHPKSSEGDIITDQYIIKFNPEVIPAAISYIDDVSTISSREKKGRLMTENGEKVTAQINKFLDKYGIDESSVLYTYTALEAGVALKINEDIYKKIQNDPVIIELENDRVETLPPFTVESVDTENASRAQTTPCGIWNAGGPANAGSSRWIWIVDTGIDLDHPDLNVINYGPYSKSFVGGNADDCHGHGTHVAGTAAARNNSFGVIGVAANAPVAAIKIFNCSGSGTTSGIIAGLNHVATYDLPGDVVNMSLGGYYGSNCSTYSSYKTVLQGLSNAGTRIAIAAGNSSSNAAYYQPACVNAYRIYTVASMTCGYSWSSFSNYNMNPIDYIATGSSVYSTYKNGGYATLSGTSMAAPHVAGICQIRNNSPQTVGHVYKNGEWYPVAKR